MEEKLTRSSRGVYKFTTTVPGMVKVEYTDSSIPQLQLDLLEIMDEVEALQILTPIIKLLKEK